MTGGGTQSGTAIGLQLVHNPDSSHVINQTYHHYYDYHGSWNENYATGVATATANNDQTGRVVNEETINGQLQEPPEPAYAVTSTQPGFKDGQIVNVALFGESFNTMGSPGFGRTIPSATTQAPHKVIIPHEAYDPHKEAITTPKWVENTSNVLWYGGWGCLRLAGGVAAWGYFGGSGLAAVGGEAGEGAILGTDGAFAEGGSLFGDLESAENALESEAQYFKLLRSQQSFEIMEGIHSEELAEIITNSSAKMAELEGALTRILHILSN